MSKTATVSVARKVRALAKAHHITAERDNMSRMATTITLLAGDRVKLDSVEQMLVNLKKKGVLSRTETLELQARYLQEKRQSKKKLSA